MNPKQVRLVNVDGASFDPNGPPPRLGPNDPLYRGHIEIEIWEPSSDGDDGVRLSAQLPQFIPVSPDATEEASQAKLREYLELILAGVERARASLIGSINGLDA